MGAFRSIIYRFLNWRSIFPNMYKIYIEFPTKYLLQSNQSIQKSCTTLNKRHPAISSNEKDVFFLYGNRYRKWNVLIHKERSVHINSRNYVIFSVQNVCVPFINDVLFMMPFLMKTLRFFVLVKINVAIHLNQNQSVRMKFK